MRIGCIDIASLPQKQFNDIYVSAEGGAGERIKSPAFLFFDFGTRPEK